LRARRDLHERGAPEAVQPQDAAHGGAIAFEDLEPAHRVEHDENDGQDDLHHRRRAHRRADGGFFAVLQGIKIVIHIFGGITAYLAQRGT
jgi:hypothetical protein